MSKNREYFHDRVILLFLAINAFLVFAIGLSTLLRIGSESSSDYIREYRSNLGLNAYSSGHLGDILAFVVFAVIIFAFQILISRRVYHIRRDVALIVTFMTALTLCFALVVVNSLLNLR